MPLRSTMFPLAAAVADGGRDRDATLFVAFGFASAALNMPAGWRPAAKAAKFSGMKAPDGPNIAAAEYTHTLVIFIKKQIRQKEDVKTYEAVSVNDERRYCCYYASLFYSTNCRRRHSKSRSPRLLPVLTHSFRFPI